MTAPAIHLFTATDERYFPHVQALLASYRHFHPSGICFVYGVDLRDASIELLNHFGAVLVAPRQVPAVSSATRAACWRFCALAEAMPACVDGTLVSYDADTIIRGRLDSISTAMTTADVAVRLRRKRNPNRRIFAGFLAVRSTPAAQQFLQTYERLLNQDEPTLYADQRCLFRAYEEHHAQRDVSFVNLVGPEMSRLLDDRALAWCPSPSGRRSWKFRSASRQWRRKFAGIP